MLVDDALTDAYLAHYTRLVRIAALLLDDAGLAEEAVQDAYVQVLGGMHRIRDPQAVTPYLRATVRNVARSRMRHRRVARKHPPTPAPNAPSAEDSVLERLERDQVLAALHTLPRRQQECLVLRYYANLSGPQIARALGISLGAVKSHMFRGTIALRQRLAQAEQANRPAPFPS